MGSTFAPPSPVVAVAGSYRDPSGTVFEADGQIIRSVEKCYQRHFDLFMGSGLFDQLVSEGLLIPHVERDKQEFGLNEAYKVISPKRIEFLSYPYEWSFSQLKDAALLTLSIARKSLEKGLVLKDASAYNVQFVGARPIFIDTLSFEQFEPNRPWVAYKQFCEHFLAPLALMQCCDVQLGQMLKVFFDGIPLTLAAKLLPKATMLNFGLLTHIHLHAKTQKGNADARLGPASTGRTTSVLQLQALLENLESTIRGLKNPNATSAWSQYYDETNYSSTAFDTKQKLVADMVAKANPKSVWDLGANTGIFSRIAAAAPASCIAFDVDHDSVDSHYQALKHQKVYGILPLVLDLTNPTPGVGWLNKERKSLIDRGPVDLSLALALIHHLSIAHNWPLAHSAQFFSTVTNWLLIEFVPKSDSQVKRLLASREDIFDKYNLDEFVLQYSKYFEVIDQRAIEGSERQLFLMRRKETR